MALEGSCWLFWKHLDLLVSMGVLLAQLVGLLDVRNPGKGLAQFVRQAVPR